MTKEKETVLVRKKPILINHKLPKEVSEALNLLPMLERQAYCIALSNKGWTYQSIANELGLSREMVRLYAQKPISEELMNKVKHLPMPEIPTKEVYSTRFKKVAIDPDVLEQLKELHAKASLVRGKSPKYRKEAELFTKLAWEEKQKGVTTYAIAKAIGITNSALVFRFVRYGYQSSSGKSKVFRALTNRDKETNA